MELVTKRLLNKKHMDKEQTQQDIFQILLKDWVKDTENLLKVAYALQENDED